MTETFLILLRIGISHEVGLVPDNIDWPKIKALAGSQGLTAIMMDAASLLNDRGLLINGRVMDSMLKVQWVGEVIGEEKMVAAQNRSAANMAKLFNDNHIKTYVLKGAVIAECYPKPNHRRSSDLDCFLVPRNGDWNAWKMGNDLIKRNGYKVDTDFYKNSSFYLPNLLVESHKFLTPFRGNKCLCELEGLLQSLLYTDGNEDKFEGVELYRPPVMVSALFLIEHSYSHFLHEGLTWRHILDWVMFKQRHQNDILWDNFDEYVNKFGFKKFYDAYNRMGDLLMGTVNLADLSKVEKRMLADIWAPLDLHETLHGVKGKLSLAGNTWRARWKYRYFTDINWFQALWIQVKGFLFMKNPTLN